MKITKILTIIVILLVYFILIMVIHFKNELIIDIPDEYGLISDEFVEVEPILFEVRPENNNSDILNPKPKVSTAEPINYIPVCSSSEVKTYMDYKTITNTSSVQYKYIQDNMIVDKNGILIDEQGYYGVALGSYFGDIGSKYVFNLDTGVSLPVVKVDEKSDKHTDSGCEHKQDKSVIEFVIDEQTAKNYFGNSSNNLVLSGNFNNHENFKGKIESIEIIL